MKDMVLYEFGESPLKEARLFVNGERYVTSGGDVLRWDSGAQDFTFDMESPLDRSLDENSVENLTSTQLKLFWVLCK